VSVVVVVDDDDDDDDDAVMVVVVVVVIVVLAAAAVMQRFVYMKISCKNMKLVKKLAGVSAEGFSWLDYGDVTSCTDTVTVNKYISEVNKERNAIKAHTVHCIALLHFAIYQDRLQGDTY